MNPIGENQHYDGAYIADVRACEAVCDCLKALTEHKAEISYGHTKVRHGANWDNDNDWHWEGDAGVHCGYVLRPARDFGAALEIACMVGITVELVPDTMVRCTLGKQVTVVVALDDNGIDALRAAACKAVCRACLQLQELL